MTNPLANQLDDLNNALAAAQLRLFSMNLGAEARVNLGHGTMDQLWWTKIGSNWQLAVSNPADGDNKKPLASATVALKKLAAHALPELLAAMHVAATSEAAELEAAGAAARAFANGA